LKCNSSYIEISQAIILNENLYLMQLRDFKPNIIFPGHWGFYAGHWEKNETAEDAMMRELNEELCWQPKILTYLGNITVEEDIRIHVHKCKLNCDMGSLTLQEGQEIGAFTIDEITRNSLFSHKWKRCYPITPISEKVFQHFIEKMILD
tara:strand:- start:105 stop:551 length:447 start_codon:yes stop_codon:yes gene_type:complete